MEKLIYVTNVYGHYFSVQPSIPMDRKAMSGCSFFTSEEAMFRYLEKDMGCEPEMLHSDAINRIERHGDQILCIDDRAEESLGDMTVEQYITDWEV